MRIEPYVIHVDHDSDLVRALDNGNQEVVLVSGDERFKVSRDAADPWDNYDPEAFRRALHNIAGLISPEEAERRKEQLYRWREEGTRPPTRP
jgi:hypothetical protein